MFLSYAFITALVGNIVCFICGISLAWSSPELPKLNDTASTVFDTVPTDEESSWIGALPPLGAAFGPFIFGYPADKFGRKNTLLAAGLPFLAAYIMLAFGNVLAVFDVARFLIGIGIGGVFCVIPMYMAEIAEDSNRGTFGSMMNCFLCSGLLFSYSLGPYVSVTVFNSVLIVFPCLFLVLFFIIAPESPHYFISKNEDDKAMESLKKLRSNSQELQNEFQAIKTSVNDVANGSILDLVRTKSNIKALIISVSLVSLQQLSGINAVLFFAQDIFKASNTSLEPAVCSIFIGLTQFVTSFVTPIVADKLGRKILLIGSAIGMIISEVPLGIYFILDKNGTDVSAVSWLPILCLIAYIVTYNCGFGPLPWTVMAEVFPPNVKSTASAVTAAICWFMGFLITKFFKNISDAIGMGVAFLIFSGFCVVAVFFSTFYLIETKEKSFKEIQEALES